MPDWKKDFTYLWESIRVNYAYLNESPCDWNAVPGAYSVALSAVRDEFAFIRLMERVLDELCDAHIALGTNLDDSLRLVPSGTDVWVRAKSDGLYVTDLRHENVPLRLGERVLGVGRESIDAALARLWPRTVPKNSPTARTYLANRLVAGRHDAPRVVRTARGLIALGALPEAARRVSFGRRGRLGWIRPHDSLGDNRLIADFDAAMRTLVATDGLILDLTDTPSGGNTTVGRAILGWFVTKETPYQRHEDPTEQKRFDVRRFWTEWVAPRAGKAYEKPLVVVANRWTGSMGEGIAIALQGMGRAMLVGGPMAGLKGATAPDTMPETKLRFQFPTERLFRIDGTPRERCQPDIAVATREALAKAEALLRKRR